MRVAAAITAVVLATAPLGGSGDPTLEQVLERMGRYVATYGEKASLFVAVEKYSQSITYEGQNQLPPRRLVAEFAIVKAPGDNGWLGYRDVVEVDGRAVSDRRDRLMTLLTDAAADSNGVIALANESARYNVGPISRNFNTPTSTLFFFYPASLLRFAFTRKGTRKLEGVETWEVQFKETKSPTIVTTRSGKNVPLEGTLWVSPADGAILKSRLVLRNFADQMTQPTQEDPTTRTSTVTARGHSVKREAMGERLDFQRINTLADIEVTYARNDALGVWLPSKMTEMYAGPIPRTAKPPLEGVASTKATYSDFKQFGADVKINVPK